MGKYVTLAICTLRVSQYLSFFKRTIWLFGCQSDSTYAPLLTILPGRVQASPYFATTSRLTGTMFDFATTSGKNDTGVSVLTSSVYGSGARTPSEDGAALPAIIAFAFFTNSTRIVYFEPVFGSALRCHP